MKKLLKATDRRGRSVLAMAARGGNEEVFLRALNVFTEEFTDIQVLYVIPILLQPQQHSQALSSTQCQVMSYEVNRFCQECLLTNLFMYVCMYRCMVITYSRVWINRVRLPILLVVSRTGEISIPLSPCMPENLVPRDGFSRSAPRQPDHLHTQAESDAYLRDSSRVPQRRPFMKPPYVIGSVPSLSGHAIAYR